MTESSAVNSFQEEADLALSHESFIYATSSEPVLTRLATLLQLGTDALSLCMLEHYIVTLRLDSTAASLLENRTNRKILESIARDFQIREQARFGKTLAREVVSEETIFAITKGVIGALLLSRGYEHIRETVALYLYSDTDTSPLILSDAKSALQETCEKAGHPAPQYSVVGEDGPDHARVFTVQVSAYRSTARGSGTTKKLASMAAAEALMNRIGGSVHITDDRASKASWDAASAARAAADKLCTRPPLDRTGS